MLKDRSETRCRGNPLWLPLWAGTGACPYAKGEREKAAEMMINGE